MADQPTDERRRRTFGPVVLAGLGSAALAAVVSARPWMDAPTDAGSADTAAVAVETGSRYPLAAATSLVLLAAWGVLLVTRGRVRRVFAVLALVAALAWVATVVGGYLTLPDEARDSFDELIGRGRREPEFTGWFWTAVVCAVLVAVPAAFAVRLVGSWPEMGARYDAPGRAPGGAPGRSGRTGRSLDPERELWHELDEGRDPTDTRP